MAIKLLDIAYGRVRAPDLDEAERFLLAFGMRRAARTEGALYMRGYGGSHHLHVVEQGDAGAVSLAFLAESESDLLRASQLAGASPVEAIHEPGGGKRVRLTEPNGLCIEVVHGIAAAAASPVPTHPLNTSDAPTRRAGGMTEMAPRPAHVWRIGHGVVFTPKVEETARWFMDTFGMLISDVVHDGVERNTVGNFLRLNRGAELVDHHTLFIAYAPVAGIHHLSFEVADLDDLLLGKEYLSGLPYAHLWGVSRHVQGGQISDYWTDPTGVMLEHWTDSDRLDANEPTRYLTREQSRGPWGPPATAEFRAHALTPIVPWGTAVTKEDANV